MVKTNKVKARMVELGVTYTEIANYIGIDYSTLSLKISNDRRIYLDEVAKLCVMLNIHTPAELKDYFNLDFLILS